MSTTDMHGAATAARSRLADRVGPALDLALDEAARPPSWSASLDGIAWALADGAVDGLLLVLRTDRRVRRAMLELVSADTRPGVDTPGPAPERIVDPEVYLFVRRTPAWSDDSHGRVLEAAGRPEPAAPTGPAPTRVAGVWVERPFALVLSIGDESPDR